MTKNSVDLHDLHDPHAREGVQVSRTHTHTPLGGVGVCVPPFTYEKEASAVQVSNDVPCESLETASVVRYAVLIRTATDRVELLGQIHDSLGAAECMASFWQAHYRDTIQAEVVQFSVPTRGTAVPLAADVVVGGAMGRGPRERRAESDELSSDVLPQVQAF